MPISVANFCREASGTGGTGTYNLGGATGRYQTFVDAVGDGAKVYYHAFDDQDFESGIGTITDGSPDTLSRDTILESSNADAAVDWPASGQRTIVMTAPASKTILADENDDTSLPRDLYLDGAINYDATDTGAADAYAIQLASTLTAYRDGLLVMFKAANANTGASTLNVNGIGAKNLKRRNGDSLESGDIAVNDRIIAYYDATDDEFRSINIAGTAADYDASANATADTVALRDGSGRLESYIERVSVKLNASESISNDTNTEVPWDVENYDVGNFWSSGTATDLVVPRDGFIVVSYFILFASNATGYREVILNKNIGFITDGGSNSVNAVDGDDTRISATSHPIEVSANDVINVTVYQNSGGSLSIESGSSVAIYYIE